MVSGRLVDLLSRSRSRQTGARLAIDCVSRFHCTAAAAAAEAVAVSCVVAKSSPLSSSEEEEESVRSQPVSSWRQLQRETGREQSKPKQ